MIKKIELGDKAKDLVSGFIGIVNAKIECLNGCLRYELMECERKGVENKFRTVEVDSQQIKRLDGGINKTKKTEQTKTGGRMKFGVYNKNDQCPTSRK